MILKTALSESLVSNYRFVPNSDGVYYDGTVKGFVCFTCRCGKQFKLRETNSFSDWNSIACSDCKRKSRLKENIGERYVFKRVKWDAKKSGRSFNISFEWFVKTIQEPCHYCNRSRVNKVNVASKKPGEYLLVDFRYNGLDRVDNAVGYEESNCVPCCVVCNRAKNSMPYDEFIEYIQSMVNYQNSVGGSNVTDDYALQDSRISYQGRHRKTGNDPDIEKPQEDSIPVSTPQFWTNIYYGLDGEVWYSYGGGSYRKLEGTI